MLSKLPLMLLSPLPLLIIVLTVPSSKLALSQPNHSLCDVRDSRVMDGVKRGDSASGTAASDCPFYCNTYDGRLVVLCAEAVHLDVSSVFNCLNCLRSLTVVNLSSWLPNCHCTFLQFVMITSDYHDVTFIPVSCGVTYFWKHCGPPQKKSALALTKESSTTDTISATRPVSTFHYSSNSHSSSDRQSPGQPIPNDSPTPEHPIPINSPTPAHTVPDDSASPEYHISNDSPTPGHTIPNDLSTPGYPIPNDSATPGHPIPYVSWTPGHPVPNDLSTRHPIPNDSSTPGDAITDDSSTPSHPISNDSPTPGHLISDPDDSPTPGHSVPYDSPTPGHSVPYDSPTSGHSVLYDMPTPGHSVPYDSPTSGHSVPYDTPNPGHSVPYDSPTSGHSVSYDTPTPGHSVPYDSPTPGHSVPYDTPNPGHSVSYDSPTPGHSVPYDSPTPGHSVPYDSPTPGHLISDSDDSPTSGHSVPYDTPAPGLSVPYDTPTPELFILYDTPTPGHPFPDDSAAHGRPISKHPSSDSSTPATTHLHQPLAQPSPDSVPPSGQRSPKKSSEPKSFKAKAESLKSELPPANSEPDPSIYEPEPSSLSSLLLRLLGPRRYSFTSGLIFGPNTSVSGFRPDLGSYNTHYFARLISGRSAFAKSSDSRSLSLFKDSGTDRNFSESRRSASGSLKPGLNSNSSSGTADSNNNSRPPEHPGDYTSIGHPEPVNAGSDSPPIQHPGPLNTGRDFLPFQQPGPVKTRGDSDLSPSHGMRVKHFRRRRLVARHAKVPRKQGGKRKTISIDLLKVKPTKNEGVYELVQPLDPRPARDKLNVIPTNREGVYELVQAINGKPLPPGAVGLKDFTSNVQKAGTAAENGKAATPSPTPAPTPAPVLTKQEQERIIKYDEARSYHLPDPWIMVLPAAVMALPFILAAIWLYCRSVRRRSVGRSASKEFKSSPYYDRWGGSLCQGISQIRGSFPRKPPPNADEKKTDQGENAPAQDKIVQEAPERQSIPEGDPIKETVTTPVQPLNEDCQDYYDLVSEEGQGEGSNSTATLSEDALSKVYAQSPERTASEKGRWFSNSPKRIRFAIPRHGGPPEPRSRSATPKSSRSPSLSPTSRPRRALSIPTGMGIVAPVVLTGTPYSSFEIHPVSQKPRHDSSTGDEEEGCDWPSVFDLARLETRQTGVKVSAQEPNLPQQSVMKRPNQSITSVLKAPSQSVTSVVKTPNRSVTSVVQRPNQSVTSVVKTSSQSVTSLEKLPSQSVKSAVKNPSQSVTSAVKKPSQPVPAVVKKPSQCLTSVEEQPNQPVKSLMKTPSQTVTSVVQKPNQSVTSVVNVTSGIEELSTSSMSVFITSLHNQTPNLALKGAALSSSSMQQQKSKELPKSGSELSNKTYSSVLKQVPSHSFPSSAVQVPRHSFATVASQMPSLSLTSTPSHSFSAKAPQSTMSASKFRISPPVKREQEKLQKRQTPQLHGDSPQTDRHQALVGMPVSQEINQPSAPLSVMSKTSQAKVASSSMTKQTPRQSSTSVSKPNTVSQARKSSVSQPHSSSQIHDSSGTWSNDSCMSRSYVSTVSQSNASDIHPVSSVSQPGASLVIDNYASLVSQANASSVTQLYASSMSQQSVSAVSQPGASSVIDNYASLVSQENAWSVTQQYASSISQRSVSAVSQSGVSLMSQSDASENKQCLSTAKQDAVLLSLGRNDQLYASSELPQLRTPSEQQVSSVPSISKELNGHLHASTGVRENSLHRVPSEIHEHRPPYSPSVLRGLNEQLYAPSELIEYRQSYPPSGLKARSRPNTPSELRDTGQPLPIKQAAEPTATMAMLATASPDTKPPKSPHKFHTHKQPSVRPKTRLSPSADCKPPSPKRRKIERHVSSCPQMPNVRKQEDTPQARAIYHVYNNPSTPDSSRTTCSDFFRREAHTHTENTSQSKTQTGSGFPYHWEVSQSGTFVSSFIQGSDVGTDVGTDDSTCKEHKRKFSSTPGILETAGFAMISDTDFLGPGHNRSEMVQPFVEQNGITPSLNELPRSRPQWEQVNDLPDDQVTYGSEIHRMDSAVSSALEHTMDLSSRISNALTCYTESAAGRGDRQTQLTGLLEFESTPVVLETSRFAVTTSNTNMLGPGIPNTKIGLAAGAVPTSDAQTLGISQSSFMEQTTSQSFATCDTAAPTTDTDQRESPDSGPTETSQGIPQEQSRGIDADVSSSFPVLASASRTFRDNSKTQQTHSVLADMPQSTPPDCGPEDTSLRELLSSDFAAYKFPMTHSNFPVLSSASEMFGCNTQKQQTHQPVSPDLPSDMSQSTPLDSEPKDPSLMERCRGLADYKSPMTHTNFPVLSNASVMFGCNTQKQQTHQPVSQDLSSDHQHTSLGISQTHKAVSFGTPGVKQLDHQPQELSLHMPGRQTLKQTVTQTQNLFDNCTSPPDASPANSGRRSPRRCSPQIDVVENLQSISGSSAPSYNQSTSLAIYHQSVSVPTYDQSAGLPKDTITLTEPQGVSLTGLPVMSAGKYGRFSEKTVTPTGPDVVSSNVSGHTVMSTGKHYNFAGESSANYHRSVSVASFHQSIGLPKDIITPTEPRSVSLTGLPVMSAGKYGRFSEKTFTHTGPDVVSGNVSRKTVKSTGKHGIFTGESSATGQAVVPIEDTVQRETVHFDTEDQHVPPPASVKPRPTRTTGTNRVVVMKSETAKPIISESSLKETKSIPLTREQRGIDMFEPDTSEEAITTVLSLSMSEKSADRLISKTSKGSEDQLISQTRKGSENRLISQTPKGSENRLISQTPKGSENRLISQTPKGSENRLISQTPKGSEDRLISQTSKGVKVRTALKGSDVSETVSLQTKASSTDLLMPTSDKSSRMSFSKSPPAKPRCKARSLPQTYRKSSSFKGTFDSEAVSSDGVTPQASKNTKVSEAKSLQAKAFSRNVLESHPSLLDKDHEYQTETSIADEKASSKLGLRSEKTDVDSTPCKEALPERKTFDVPLQTSQNEYSFMADPMPTEAKPKDPRAKHPMVRSDIVKPRISDLYLRETESNPSYARRGFVNRYRTRLTSDSMYSVASDGSIETTASSQDSVTYKTIKSATAPLAIKTYSKDRTLSSKDRRGPTISEESALSRTTIPESKTASTDHSVTNCVDLTGSEITVLESSISLDKKTSMTENQTSAASRHKSHTPRCSTTGLSDVTASPGNRLSFQTTVAERPSKSPATNDQLRHVLPYKASKSQLNFSAGETPVSDGPSCKTLRAVSSDTKDVKCTTQRTHTSASMDRKCTSDVFNSSGLRTATSSERRCRASPVPSVRKAGYPRPIPRRKSKSDDTRVALGSVFQEPDLISSDNAVTRPARALPHGNCEIPSPVAKKREIPTTLSWPVGKTKKDITPPAWARSQEVWAVSDEPEISADRTADNHVFSTSSAKRLKSILRNVNRTSDILHALRVSPEEDRRVTIGPVTCKKFSGENLVDTESSDDPTAWSGLSEAGPSSRIIPGSRANPDYRHSNLNYRSSEADQDPSNWSRTPSATNASAWYTDSGSSDGGGVSLLLSSGGSISQPYTRPLYHPEYESDTRPTCRPESESDTRPLLRLESQFYTSSSNRPDISQSTADPQKQTSPVPKPRKPQQSETRVGQRGAGTNQTARHVNLSQGFSTEHLDRRCTGPIMVTASRNGMEQGTSQTSTADVRIGAQASRQTFLSAQSEASRLRGQNITDMERYRAHHAPAPSSLSGQHRAAPESQVRHTFHPDSGPSSLTQRTSPGPPMRHVMSGTRTSQPNIHHDTSPSLLDTSTRDRRKPPPHIVPRVSATDPSERLRMSTTNTVQAPRLSTAEPPLGQWPSLDMELAHAARHRPTGDTDMRTSLTYDPTMTRTMSDPDTKMSRAEMSRIVNDPGIGPRTPNPDPRIKSQLGSAGSGLGQQWHSSEGQRSSNPDSRGGPHTREQFHSTPSSQLSHEGVRFTSDMLRSPPLTVVTPPRGPSSPHHPTTSPPRRWVTPDLRTSTDTSGSSRQWNPHSEAVKMPIPFQSYSSGQDARLADHSVTARRSLPNAVKHSSPPSPHTTPPCRQRAGSFNAGAGERVFPAVASPQRTNQCAQSSHTNPSRKRSTEKQQTFQPDRQRMGTEGQQAHQTAGERGGSWMRAEGQQASSTARNRTGSLMGTAGQQALRIARGRSDSLLGTEDVHQNARGRAGSLMGTEAAGETIEHMMGTMGQQAPQIARERVASSLRANRQQTPETKLPSQTVCAQSGVRQQYPQAANFQPRGRQDMVRDRSGSLIGTQTITGRAASFMEKDEQQAPQTDRERSGVYRADWQQATRTGRERSVSLQADQRQATQTQQPPHSVYAQSVDNRQDPAQATARQDTGRDTSATLMRTETARDRAGSFTGEDEQQATQPARGSAGFRTEDDSEEDSEEEEQHAPQTDRGIVGRFMEDGECGDEQQATQTARNRAVFFIGAAGQQAAQTAKERTGPAGARTGASAKSATAKRPTGEPWCTARVHQAAGVEEHTNYNASSRLAESVTKILSSALAEEKQEGGSSSYVNLLSKCLDGLLASDGMQSHALLAVAGGGVSRPCTLQPTVDMCRAGKSASLDKPLTSSHSASANVVKPPGTAKSDPSGIARITSSVRLRDAVTELLKLTGVMTPATEAPVGKVASDPVPSKVASMSKESADALWELLAGVDTFLAKPAE